MALSLHRTTVPLREEARVVLWMMNSHPRIEMWRYRSLRICRYFKLELVKSEGPCISRIEIGDTRHFPSSCESVYSLAYMSGPFSDSTKFSTRIRRDTDENAHFVIDFRY